MNEIGHYEQNNKKYKLFLDFNRNKERGLGKLGKLYFGRITKVETIPKIIFILKIQCYSREMFEHFVNAWNLDKTKIKLDVSDIKNKKDLILLFKGEWHETRQFLIIVEKYLNDRNIELILNNEMIGAILMIRELGK